MALTREEARLAKQDPNLTGLADLLDEEAMHRNLARAYGIDDIRSVRKTYVRYKPGTNCLVKYSVDLGGNETEVYAKSYGRCDAEKRAKAEQRQAATGPRQVDTGPLSDKGIVANFFPNDSKLRNLYRLHSTELCDRLIKRALPDHPGFRGGKIERLQYKPERRFVGKLTSPDGVKATIKLYTRKRFDTVAISGKESAADAVLPNVIGKSDKYNILVLDWISGVPLSDNLLTTEPSRQSFFDTGKALAAFHENNGIRISQRRDTHEFIATLFDLTVGLEHLVPELGNRPATLTRALAGGISALAGERTRIHGDFYAKQVLQTENGIQFIDIDDICDWYPVYDIGLFIAHLERDSLRGTITREQAQSLEYAMLDGYLGLRDCSMSEIQLFVAVGLLQLVHHPFRNCEANWPAKISELLSRSEKRFEKYRVLRDAGTLHSVSALNGDT